MNEIKNLLRVRPYILMSLVLIVAAFLTMQTRSQSTSTTIFGCYKKNNGQLRIVSGPAQCGPSEVGISWNNGGDTSLGQHHQESTFTIGPSSSVVSLPVPATDKPVHIDFSATGQTDAGNVPVKPLVGTFAAVKETATGLVNFNDTFALAFDCGDIIGVNVGNDVEFTYAPSGCGPNPVTVHVNMWY
jgi:hypothetical protein